MAKMTRRTTAKKAVAVVEEPTTVPCEEVETIIEKREIVRCRDCNNQEWRNGVCFTHWKESQGFVFDEDRKVFVKAGK